MNDIVAARLVSVLAAGIAAALVWIVAEKLTRDRLAAHLSALAFLTHQSFLRMAAMGARPKVFLVMFVLLAVLAMSTRKPMRTGGTIALAFLCWQPALLVGAGALEPILRARRPVRVVAGVVAGAAITFLVYEAYFVWKGAFGEQLEQAFFFPAIYMRHRQPIPALAPLALHARWLFRLGAEPALRTLVPWGTLVVLFVCLAVALWRPRDAIRSLAGQPGRAAFVLAAAWVFAFTIYDYQCFPDSFFVIPFASIIVGWGMAFSARWLGRVLHPWCGHTVAAMLLVLLVSATPVVGVRPSPGADLDQQLRLGDEVGALLERGLSIYAVGCTHLLAFAHASNFVRYGFFFRGMNRYLTGTFRRAYRPERSGELPDVVLWSRGRPNKAGPWLVRAYDEVTLAPFASSGVRVWLRKDLAGPFQSR